MEISKLNVSFHILREGLQYIGCVDNLGNEPVDIEKRKKRKEENNFSNIHNPIKMEIGFVF